MRKAHIIIIILPIVTLFFLGACTSTMEPTSTLAPESTPTVAPTTPPKSPQASILGKWRHGLPEECPASMDSRQYEEFKKLPENKTHYLEFLENGEVLHIDDEGRIFNGTYRFISDEYVEITWNVLVGSLAWELFGGHGVYEIKISGDEMWLTGGPMGFDTSYRRVD
jgi:hypothetical protein